LTRIKAATQLEVAAAFAVKPATVRRWEARLTGVGVPGLDTAPLLRRAAKSRQQPQLGVDRPDVTQAGA